MPIILLVFVNYARFSKKKMPKLCFSLFTLNLVKKKKNHTHTSMLHLQVNDKLIYPVYIKKLFECLIHFLKSIKTQTINNQDADAIPGNHRKINEFVT